MRLWKIQTLIVNAVVALGFLAHGSYSAWKQTERERAEVIKDARSLAQSIAAGSADDVLAQSYDRIESHLLRQVHLSSVRELLISDGDGRVLSKVRRLQDNRVAPVYGELVVQEWPLNNELMSATQYTYYEPIERGSLLGYVGVTAGLERLEDVRVLIWQDTLRDTLLVVLFLSLIQGFALRRIGRALEHTTHFANELINHRGKTVPTQSRVTELRDLKTALNRVSVDLSRQHRSLTESEARKSAILEAWMDCLIIVDLDGRVVEFNKAAEQTFGFQREEIIGKDMVDRIIPERMRAAHSAGMRHYRDTGTGPALGKRLDMPALRKSGEEFPVELTIIPFIAHGQSFFLGAIRDISAQKALERERKAAEDQLLSTLADLDARDRALDDHAIVSVTDLQGTIIYANGKFSEVSGYTNGELIGQNHRILKSGFHDRAFYEQMWSTICKGRTWHGEIANRRKDGALYWVMSTIVPVLDSEGLPRQYIAIRTDISEQKRIGQELAKARARELAFGFQIQQTLLLGEIPTEVGPISLAAQAEPSAGIDGDFYEFAWHDPDLFDLAVGDVMGKGVPAALIGAGVKQKLGRISQTYHFAPIDPEDIVNEVHQRLFDSLLELGSFVTFAYLRFDQKSNRLTFVDAGHTKAILANATGARFLQGDNLPLGVSVDEVYQQHSVVWKPGDTLLLYSDGLTEARNPAGEMFGPERLTPIIADLNRERVPASVINQAVRAAVLTFGKGRPLDDDNTCIVVDFPDGTPPLATMQLHWTPDALATLRGEVERAAAVAGLDPPAVQALVLAVSETGANIVRHNPEPLNGSRVHVLVRADAKAVEVVFHYIGRPFEKPICGPDFSGQSDSGFGLFIVRESVDEVSYEALPHQVFRISLRKRWTPAEPDAGF